MKELYKKYQRIIKYFCYSCISTVLDVAIVWVLYDIMSLNLVFSNTCGVIAGFVLSYLLSTESVFDTALGFAGFAVYLGTFLVGLVFADLLISVSNNIFVAYFSPPLSFLLSKGVSIILPFFALYFMRKWLYSLLKKRGEKNE